MTDSDQQKIVELAAENALVLAGPGCGKTHILARRVFHAMLYQGVAPEAMLCLTFTNRAAREMQQRIHSYMGNMPAGLFVGNLHRFGIRFLIANNLIDEDMAVLDDEDMAIFLRETFTDGPRRDAEVIQRNSTILYMREHNFDRTLIPRDRYGLDLESIRDVEVYRKFKEQNRLIDFDDILLLTYQALRTAEPRQYAMSGYRWIQIDEVQDLSALQLALVDLLRGQRSEVLYLGDEQQSIYGFAGAGRRVLENVKRRCGANLYHLGRNYRSPRQLVEFCNNYALQYLDIDPDYLPASVQGDAERDCVSLAACGNRQMEYVAAALAKQCLKHQEQNVAILARTNRDAEAVSRALCDHGLDHVLVSRNDLFRAPAFKTVWSHLAVTLRPDCRSPWARLLYQTGATRTLTEARALVARLSNAAISPVQLLGLDSLTDVEQYIDYYDDPKVTIAVFDTETTGLDVLDDDVIQIAAVKVRSGQVIAGSEFNVYIDSAKHPPEYLGAARNPLYDSYKSATKINRREALCMFGSYLDDCVAAGHNIGFDAAILRANYSREGLPVPAALEAEAPTIDTLRFATLLFPRLRSHTLNFMLGYLDVAGRNSHLADDDAMATANLLQELVRRGRAYLPQIAQMKHSPEFRRASLRFSEAYGPLYRLTRELYESESVNPENTLAEAFRSAYVYFLGRGYIRTIPHIEYLLKLIGEHVVDAEREPRLREQLAAHLHEMLSFNEGDLYAQNIINERLIVMTIHKAKGMEMDSVIVYNAGLRFGSLEESMRVFYVAISRARRRLVLLFGGDPGITLGLLADQIPSLSPDALSALLISLRV